MLFAVSGALLFLGAALVEQFSRNDDGPRRLVVTNTVQQDLAVQFARAQGRAPTPEEQREAVERYVQDQVLFEQALEWGLHHNDVVVKRRLVERLRMLFASYADIDRDDQALQATYEKYKNRFVEPAKIGFRQVFVDRDVHGDETLERARQLRAEIEAGGAGEGDVWYQSPTQTPRSLSRIGVLMGQDFATALNLLDVGKWSPPIASSFGHHLVFIEEKIAARTVPLEEALERVWVLHRRDREREAFAEFSTRLRERYEVVIEQVENDDEAR
ncbi:MAG: peptidylprolyl isomerase [Pseudomonadota bacterium]